ncbi:hypothetical protein P2C94_22660, partial [Xanthomonas perforans]
ARARRHTALTGVGALPAGARREAASLGVIGWRSSLLAQKPPRTMGNADTRPPSPPRPPGR